MMALHPTARLYCQNPSCAHTAEAWCFKAFGEEDVNYVCPRCNTVAGTVAVAAAPTINNKSEVPEMRFPNAPVMRPQTSFLIVSFDPPSMKIEPESIVFSDNADIDADVVIPMLPVAQLSGLPEQPRKQFMSQFRILLEALEEGTCPLLPEVEGWLTEVADFVEAQGEPAEAIEEFPDKFASPSANFDQLFIEGFSHGFQAGVTYALSKAFGNLMQRADEVVHEHHTVRHNVEPAPARPQPLPKGVVPPTKKSVLLKALQAQKQKMSKKGAPYGNRK